MVDGGGGWEVEAEEGMGWEFGRKERGSSGGGGGGVGVR